MRIEVKGLQDNQELALEEDIPASQWEIDSSDIKFIGNIHLDCRLIKISKAITATVEVTTQRKITCSRCLKEVDQPHRDELKLAYSLDQLGEYLEIDKDVREEVLLVFPMKVFCREDCRGLCSHCGADLNLGQCQCNKKQVT